MKFSKGNNEDYGSCTSLVRNMSKGRIYITHPNCPIVAKE